MNLLDLSLDALIVALSVGTAIYAFIISNRFKGGKIAASWRFIGPATAIFALSWMVHVANEFFPFAYSDEIHILLQAVFIFLLFYGLYALDAFWGKKASP